MTSPKSEFIKFDADGDGYLNANELQGFLTSSIALGRPFNMKSVEYFMSTFGVTCGKGRFISFDNFPALVLRIQLLLEKFRQFDRSKTGRISCSDMCRVFQDCRLACDQETIEMIGRRYDEDHSGTLEFDEFCQFMLEWEFYGDVFQKVDADRNGMISIFELEMMLTELQQNDGQNDGQNVWVEQWTNRWARSSRPFSPHTCWLLLTKFGISRDPSMLPELDFAKFGQLLIYLGELKAKFVRHDINHSNFISGDELVVAFANMGLVAPKQLIQKIGEIYDEDSSGALEFDEFCRLITEWDQYLELFKAHGELPTPGGTVCITPVGLQRVLAAMTDVNTFHPDRLQHAFRKQESSKLFESSCYMREFSVNTCALIVREYGANGKSLTILEFCTVLEFIKSLKISFHKLDQSQSGFLSYGDVYKDLCQSGIVISEATITNIMNTYDIDLRYHGREAALSFDSFVRLRADLLIYKNSFDRYATNGQLTLNFNNMMDFVYQIPHRTPETVSLERGKANAGSPCRN